MSESKRGEFLRSDATIAYKSELSERLDQTYPEINSTTKESLEALRRKDIRFASFSIRERGLLD